MVRIPFQWLENAFECFESFSNGWNLHFNASHPFQMLQFKFETFQYRSDLHLNALNPFRMVSIRMLQILFEWFEFGFERLESLFNSSDLHLNASNPFWFI